MKNLTKIFLSIFIAFTLFVLPTPVKAKSTDGPSKVSTREILSDSATFYETYGSNKVKIVVRYTYRFEASNGSKKFITGILGGTITNVSGWTSIGSQKVYANSVSYSDNCQIATIPYSYYGSIGIGNNIYVSGSVKINLY